MSDLSHGLYQCPNCHGPSDGPGECPACLTRPRDYSEFISQPASTEQIQRYLLNTYGSSSPVEILEQEFQLRPPSSFVQSFLDDTETMEAAMRLLERRPPGTGEPPPDELQSW